MSGICTAVLSVSYRIFDHRTGPILVQKDTGHKKYHVGGISRVMYTYHIPVCGMLFLVTGATYYWTVYRLYRD
jgi:hypothetical protein